MAEPNRSAGLCESTHDDGGEWLRLVVTGGS